MVRMNSNFNKWLDGKVDNKKPIEMRLMIGACTGFWS